MLSAIWNYAPATHIVGGEITYRCLGSAPGNQYRYEVTLNVYRSCSPGSFGFDNTAEIAIYEAGSLVRTDTLSIDLAGTDTLEVTAFDTCFAPPPGICYEHTAYVKEVLLPASPNGYFLSWARCCRNGTIANIVNPLSTGMTYAANIPATGYCNSSPAFDEQPPTFICLNEPFTFDHGATDPDGDSLVYALTPPWDGASQGNPVPDPPPPPYSPVTWAPPYSILNILGGNPPMAIDADTGLLTAHPDQPGQFVFSVSVCEYRDGVLLSEVKRDFQLNVMTCPRNNPPQIVRPTGPNVVGDTLIFVTGQDNCFPITVLDQNTGTGVDSVTINGTGAIFGGTSFPGPYATLADSGLSPLSADICWHPLCHQAGTVHKIMLPARDNWDCPEPHVVFDTLYAKVVPATPEPPEIRCVSVDAPGAITLSWLNPPPARLDGFHAYVLERNAGQGWTVIASLPDSLTMTYTDNTVTGADSIRYCYRLSTAKDCPDHLRGPPGNTACSIVPDVLKINQVQSDISWNAYDVWPGPLYAVFGDSTGIPFLVADQLRDTSHLYTACYLDARFRIRTIDPLTGCEAWSGWTEYTHHRDSVPGPVAMCRVSVEEGDKSVRVEWQAPGDSDLAEWRLYRRRDDQQGWTELQRGNHGSQSGFLDENTDCDAHAYCYQVEVEDICGNIRRGEPACTVLLSAEREGYTSLLDWTPYVGWQSRLEGYGLFLTKHFGGSNRLVTRGDTAQLDYLDEEIVWEVPEYCYRVRAEAAPGGCGVFSWSNEVCLDFPPTLFFPNAFSPNGDGLNDVFRHPNIFLSGFRMEIYDRWGKLIWSTENQHSFWDGTYRGKPVQEGAFVFIATGKGFDGQVLRKQGTVTIIR